MLYVVISYHLTDNYYSFDRFLLFSLFCVAGSISAQAWGFFIGATLSVKVSFTVIHSSYFDASCFKQLA